MSQLSLNIQCRGENNFQLSVETALQASGVTAVYGPSGSGKSTLLDCIAGLRQPAAGSGIRFGDEVWFDDNHRTPPWRRRVGYVFQDARLFPHLDVRQNLAYAQSRSDGAGPAGLQDICDWLALADLLSQHTERLSAGQKQRVAIARALLSNPRLLLLDEPLANLDRAARAQCLRCLQDVARRLALPMVYVSHDIEEVSQIADHVILLEGGRVAQQGPLLALCSQLDTLLSQEEQAAAIITARVVSHDKAFDLTALEAEGQTVYVNRLSQAPGTVRRVRIPARDVSISCERPTRSSILNVLEARVSEIEETTQPRLLVRLALGEQYLLARITRKSATELALQPGDRVFAQIKSVALLMDNSTPP